MRKSIAALALAGLVAFSLPARADEDDRPWRQGGMWGGGCATFGMMGPGGMMGHGGMMGWGQRGDGYGWGMMGNRPARMGALVDARLVYLRGELGITDTQTAAWDGYAEAVKARAETMQSMHETMFETMRKGSASERMDAHIAAMEAMLESLKSIKPATDALYAVLSDDQKKIADDLIGLDCGGL